MNFILWILIGGILGWIASIIMHTNAQQGLLLNIIVGIVGALVAGFVLPVWPKNANVSFSLRLWCLPTSSCSS